MNRNEPPHGKTNNLHRRKQRRRSASRYREADQRLCFRCSDCTLTLLLKSEISSFQLFSVLVQASLCRTCSETTLLVFPRGGSNDHVIINYIIVDVTILLCLLSNAFISISLNNDDICCRNLHVTLVC